MTDVVAFLPGNGHVDARLSFAREKAQRLDVGFELRSVDYGAADSFEALLDSVLEQTSGADLAYATGIGGLVYLALRARGALTDQRAILQGPVLWGLETRTFPKLMRLPLMPRALTLAIARGPIQRRFMRKHFTRPLTPEFQRVFFDGYRDARAFERWFAWLTPRLLRDLEQQLRGRPELLDGLTAWWGGEDHVVGIEELRRTEAALGQPISVREFPSWGHYPMIDEPADWTAEVARALAAPH
ncbi:Alpha/beta hydrolase family protein [Planctomycetes bacterium Poly30]|uniref:Alpha/beta hydrolase family protein n=1 Tax=Saltatorellus ferox TaxID=2528018 RepID=A0A518EZN2_9BACT|nr:Alpha/beta hydrolase family protein [Planctomycetes bacterium Poly30]